MKKFCYFLIFYIAFFSAYGQNSSSERLDKKDNKLSKEALFEQLMDSSNVYYNNGDYRKDLALNFELLKLAFEINNPYYINKGYRNLAYDYLILGDTLLAKESFEKSEKQAQLAQNDTVTALTYMDLANVYSVLTNKKKEAIDYHEKSIRLFEKLKDSSNLAKAHYNTILTALEHEDLNLSYLHLLKARKYASYGDPYFEAGLDCLLGQHYILAGKTDLAISYLKKAISSAEEIGDASVVEDAYYYYSEVLFSQGEFEAAYHARLAYEDLLESNHQKNITTEIEAVSTNYQLAEYKKDVIEAEEQFKIQGQIVRNKSRLNTFLIVVFSCFIILFIALFLAYRKRKELVRQLKLKNKEYLLAKQESEKLSRAKGEFFSTISHELRTPLYGVIGLTTILLEERGLKKHLKELKSLKFSADYLLALINDVLQINKIDSNSIENERISFNLKDLINKIASSFEYMRIQNSNDLHIHISDSVPKYIYGNSVRLSQVLMNLIGNACKFTENGNIYVIAETTTITSDKTAIKFYIRDTGVGIPIEKQENIFEEFSQLNSHDFKYHGTGLGLPIVKKLLKLDHAEITLKSEPGKGSLFSFIIEYDIATKTSSDAIEGEFDLDLLIDKRILVVEDNMINQMVTKKILEKNKMRCVLAENGQIAVDIAKKEYFDLILMDINMPMKNGIAATKEIREFNTTIPIVALTAVEIEELRFSIFESGMNDIIVKPYDITKFIQTISKNIAEIQTQPHDAIRLKAI